MVSRAVDTGTTSTTTVSRDHAPAPDEASGRRREAPEPPEPTAGRALLFLPRGLLYLVYLPFRGLSWAFDAGNLQERFEAIFFNRDRTFGAFPVVMIENPFGISVGGTAIHRNLFGNDEHARLTAAFGGRLQSGVDLELDTGNLISDANRIQLRFTYDGQPDLRFFGLGNTQRLSSFGPSRARIDPYEREVAVETATFRDRVVLDLTPIQQLSDEIELRSTFAWSWQDVSARDLEDTPINTGEVYATEDFRYFDGPFSTLIFELRFRYDSLHVPRADLPPALRSRGAFIDAFVSANQVLGARDHLYIRGGVDVRRHFDLFAGTRILVTRLYVEGVSAPIRDVPILDLPSLGGPFELRGYNRHRFRDQALWLASLEYRFPIITVLNAYVFVDTGRVFRDPAQLFESPQLGFGGGFRINDRREPLVRVQVASSRQGGVFFSLQLGPRLAGPNRLREP